MPEVPPSIEPPGADPLGAVGRLHEDNERLRLRVLELLKLMEDEVTDRAAEMVRLRRALRPMRIPVDILVASVAEVESRRLQPGHVLYWAMQEGREVYAGS